MFNQDPVVKAERDYEARNEQAAAAYNARRLADIDDVINSIDSPIKAIAEACGEASDAFFIKVIQALRTNDDNELGRLFANEIKQYLGACAQEELARRDSVQSELSDIFEGLEIR